MFENRLNKYFKSNEIWVSTFAQCRFTYTWANMNHVRHFCALTYNIHGEKNMKID